MKILIGIAIGSGIVILIVVGIIMFVRKIFGSQP